MKRKYKRLLAIALCGVLVVSNLNVTALAEDATGIEEEATEHIHAYDIIAGQEDLQEVLENEVSVNDEESNESILEEEIPDEYANGEDAALTQSGGEEDVDSNPSDAETDSSDEEEQPPIDEPTEVFTPTITVKRAANDKTKYFVDEELDRPNTYCYGPTVTVEAKSGTIKSITINGEEIDFGEAKDSYTFEINFDKYKDNRLEIYATNSEGRRNIAYVNKHAVYVGESSGYREIVTQATCTRAGYESIVHYCNYCGTRYNETNSVTYKALGHHFTDEGTVEKGCDGFYTKQICQTCGFIQTTSISSNGTGHKWGDIQVVSPVSEQDSYSEGYSYQQCEDCGFVQLVGSIEYPNAIDHKHNFDAWSTVQSVTCMSPRYEARTCSKCGYKEWRTTGSTLGGHVWRENDWQITKAPTCIEDGMRMRSCARSGCKATEKEVLPATPEQHNYESEITKEPDCVTEGTITYTCPDCGSSYTDTISATGHTPQAEHAGDCTAATVCAVCRERLQESDKQHNFTGVYKRTSDGKGHTITCVNPGCTVISPVQAHFAGEDDGDCTTEVKCRCGYPVKAAKSNHATPSGGWTSNMWKKTPTQHILYCANAGCTQPVIVYDHVFTYTNSGNGHYQRCSVCLYTTELIAHTFVIKSDGNNHWSECLDCGYKINTTRHAMQYTYNDAGHWKYCTDCGYIDESTRNGHKPAEDDDHNCMTRVECDCGYILIQGATGHNFQTGKWEHDKTYHWYNCVNKDCQVRGGYAEHIPSEVIKTNEVVPTCTKDGSYDEHTLCRICGVEMSSRHVTVSKTEHNWEVEENTATCTKAGTIYYNCTVCGATRTATSAKLDHSWGGWEYIENACGGANVRRRICQICGEIEMDGLDDPNAHSWKSEPEEDSKATCTTEGRWSIHCSKCDAVKPGSVEVIPATGHNYGIFHFVEGSADCTHDGIQTAKCYNCDAVRTEPAPDTILPHDWSDWQTLSASTCTAAGSDIRICNMCGTAETRTVPSGGHSYTDWEREADPTCVLPGRDSRYCAGCGNLQIQYIKALGHTWGEWFVEQEANCTADGRKSRLCSVCDEHEQTTVKATGHKWNVKFKWTEDYLGAEVFMVCENDSAHAEYHVATVTKEIISATCEQGGITTYIAKASSFDNANTYTDKHTESTLATGHKWSDWTVQAEATVFAPEQQIRICSLCKKTESRQNGSQLSPTITVPASNLKMKVNQKTTAFKVTGMANGDYVKSVTSSNKKVLKVSNVKPSGTLTLTAQKKTGKATLTIKLASGLTKKVKITVQKKDVKTAKISGLTKRVTLVKGRKVTLKPIITPITSTQKVTYKSSDTKVATVNSKGVVKAKKVGKAIITVKSGSKKVEVDVNVIIY